MELPARSIADRAFPYVGRSLLAYWAAYAGVVSALQVTAIHFSLWDLNPLLPVMVCTSHPFFMILALPPFAFAILYIVRRWPWWLASGIAVYSSCALTWIIVAISQAGL